jgi:signal transduction histidine kinase
MHNVVRHSGASSAIVALGATNDDLLLSVIDSGVGFDGAAARSSLAWTVTVTNQTPRLS